MTARASTERGSSRRAMRHGIAPLTWLPALLGLAGGILLRDCVLLASAGLFALGGFRRRMDQDSPQHPFAAGLRCINAGLGAMLAAAALLMMVLGAWLGWWQPRNDNPFAATAVLVVSFAVFRVLPGLPPRDAAPAVSDAGVEVLILAAALAALALEWLGVRLVCCAGATTAAVFLAWNGWHLLRNDAGFMLRAAE
jgi:hypothetical protein